MIGLMLQRFGLALIAAGLLIQTSDARADVGNSCATYLSIMIAFSVLVIAAMAAYTAAITSRRKIRKQQHADG
ncbi:hypothetical protein VSS37_03365 [Candidatus Thiothrix sp. Deng01]|uniref:Uncharacterized protein n=1 Tax=Candidatus Thiothrix phosphatis TaxID=3112415 RepID=A0ABU6CTC1_9GAMM|nr:hypothetical protein [Candidatus Thiothrix sp. Deng01]MEB4590009.1 hypothetical protein [Candidatus Thiothrix sp. Deng01]